MAAIPGTRSGYFSDSALWGTAAALRRIYFDLWRTGANHYVTVCGHVAQPCCAVYKVPREDVEERITGLIWLRGQDYYASEVSNIDRGSVVFQRTRCVL